MAKDNINWKSIATGLLWPNVIFAKNEDSGYYITKAKEIKRSLNPPENCQKLTWGELALKLGLFRNK